MQVSLIVNIIKITRTNAEVKFKRPHSDLISVISKNDVVTLTTEMRVIYFSVVVLQTCNLVFSAIKDKGPVLNKLIKPVGNHAAHKFVALTEIPPPIHTIPPPTAGRRHLDVDPDDCSKKPESRVVYEGGKVDIFGEYYDDQVAKTVATVIIPDHIDRKHFEITSPIPYLTVGPIEAIGYHPTTMKGDHPPECEKIYQDHLDEQYSDETSEYSEESLEMARMPLFAPDARPPTSLEERIDEMYDDFK